MGLCANGVSKGRFHPAAAFSESVTGRVSATGFGKAARAADISSGSAVASFTYTLSPQQLFLVFWVFFLLLPWLLILCFAFLEFVLN